MADVWQGFAGAMGGAVARLANAQAQGSAAGTLP